METVLLHFQSPGAFDYYTLKHSGNSFFVSKNMPDQKNNVGTNHSYFRIKGRPLEIK